MPSRAQFRMVLIELVGFSMAIVLVRLWAARRSQDSGALGVAADAVNATV